MILFINVLITNKPFFYVYDRGRLGWDDDKLDVFKYTLASYTVLPWQEVVIYCELDQEYSARWGELRKFVNECFPNAHLYEYRNTNQKSWQEAMRKLFAMKSDGLTWFTCNDDHPFMDFDLQCFQAIHRRMLELDKTQRYVSCQFSTWPIIFREIDAKYRESFECRDKSDPPTQLLEVQKEFFAFVSPHVYSIQIVNHNLLNAWWFDYDYGGTWLPRTDCGSNSVQGPKNIYCLCPRREISAHQDGLSHVDVDINAVYPLFVPRGFFERDIKIQYCGAVRKTGWVHINPLIGRLSTVDPAGVDYRWVLEDIPLFWRDRIAQTVTEAECDRWQLLAQRNEAALKKLGGLWVSSRESLIEAAEYSLRRDDDTRPYPLLSEAEPLKRSPYVSVYKRPRGNVSPAVSILLLEQPGGTTAHQALDSLLRQECDRSDYEVLFLTVDEVSPRKLLDKEILYKVDGFLSANDFDLWSAGGYHLQRGYNIGAVFAGGKVLALCDTLGIFPPNFVSTIKTQLLNVPVTGKYLVHAAQALQDTGQEAPKGETQSYLSVLREDFLRVGGMDEHGTFAGEAGARAELARRLNTAGFSALTSPAWCPVFTVKHPFEVLLQAKQNPAPNEGRVHPLVQNEEIKVLSEAVQKPVAGVDWTRDVTECLRKLNRSMLAGGSAGALDELMSQSRRSCSELFSVVCDGLAKCLGDEIAEGISMLNAISTKHSICELQILIGLMEFSRQQPASAEAALLRAREIDPLNYNANALLGEIYRETGRGKLAEETAVVVNLLYPKLAKSSAAAN